MPTRPIEETLARHTEDLMAAEGVVGVYQGALDDGTPCIKIAVAKMTPELEEGLPKQLDGHPVVIVETGEIVPHRDED